MAKGKKKTAKKTSQTAKILAGKPQTDLLEQLNRPRAALIFFAIVFLFLIWLYKPIALDGLDVKGSDVVSGIGNTHQIKLYEEKTGERALWNPYMFAGMPVYHRYGALSWSLDTLIGKIDPLLDWRIWYLWLGAIGMFLLIRTLGLNAIAAMMGSLAFILLPHPHALIVVGHFSKLRALMWMPFVLMSFLMMLHKRSIFNALLFVAFFALQLRTQHYQIVFYTMLLLTFAGFWPYLKLLLEKQTTDFLKFNGLLIAAAVLVGLIVAQPLLVTREYAPYSTRGGNAINLSEQVSSQDKKGVGFDYATNWSYSLAEFWNLVNPRFHGGTSNEGIPVPQLKNQQIPGYWGDLPFTQSYEYLSVLIAFLAMVGTVFQWKNPLVKSLAFLTLLALLLSLGKHFAPLYKLFFYYVPYFDKFRVPMMILTLVSFNAILLATFGLNFILSGGLSEQVLQKRFYMLSGIFAVIMASPLLFGSSLSLSSAQEFQQYAARFGEQQAQQLIDLFREARLGVLKASTWRTLGFLVVAVILLFLMIRQPKQKPVLALGFALLVGIDLGSITHGYLEGKFVNLKQVEQQNYRQNAVDKIILRDKSLYRVLPPIRVVANDSRWPYFYQSIGGYSAAKTQVIQDIITNNLLNRANPQMPLNLNVVSMLNGKYIAANQQYSDPRLAYLGKDQRQNLFLYHNDRVLPRAFFVDSVKVISDGAARLKFMNSDEFNPAKIALLETPLDQPFSPPDSNSRAAVKEFSPDKITVETATAQPALLVLSEVFYPEGWRATLETGETLAIYKTNHILRSMVVPAGEHTITLTFKPATYYTSATFSWIGWAITYLGLLFFGGFIQKRKNWR